MKCQISNRRGSALLIVLGMMAFIVVSAVAFSAYMRYARLPSSYLRRTSSSRLLAKAAVNEAIEAIDCAIGNNPYPGVGTTAYAYPRGENGGETKERNYWRDRVFIGQQMPVSSGRTVSTLSLEGLAYIPAPFVNEARYWSRHSAAGEWHTMAFDAGRYAFCAINVSDCFDVNRMVAEAGRDSSDRGRVSLAHCFENVAHTDYQVDPGDWDDFMKNYRDKNHNKVPLVSVADLNLALWGQKPSGIKSAFAEYLQQGTNAKFVKNDTPGDPEVELQKAMAFVTDSLYPMTNRVAAAIDLAREQDQPFYGFTAGKATSDKQDKNEDSLDDVMNDGSSRFLKRYLAQLQGPEVVQLYDYLDRDSVPLSLALPTVERTPMITGVGVEGKVYVSVVAKTHPEFDEPGAKINPATGKAVSRIRVTTGELQVDCSDLQVAAGFVFPFKYKRGQVPKFKAQAAATLTFVPAGEDESLRLKNAKAPAVVTRGDWSNSSKSIEAAKFGDGNTPVILTMQSGQESISGIPAKGATEENEAVLEDILFSFSGGKKSLVSDFPDPPVALPDTITKSGTFRLIERISETGERTVLESRANIRPMNGALDGLVSADAFEKGGSYVPVVQAWVRVVEDKGSGKTVDLVPACADDDETPSTVLKDLARGSNNRPLLRFRGNADGFKLTANVEEMLAIGAKDVTLAPQAYMADDPRFNYAPENLWACNSLGGTFKAEWLTKQRSGNRDGDIFMMTSDAGYLQSPYELTALLDISGINGEARTDAIDGGAFNGKIRNVGESLAADRSMWRTYSQYPAYGGSYQISRLDIANGSKGFRVNPYTEDPNIMLAALANTPLDWWAASTNFVNDTEKSGWKAKNAVTGEDCIDIDTANDHAFSEMGSSPVKVKHGKFDQNGLAQSGTLAELAQKLQNQLRGAGAGWERAFDDFDWNQDDRIGGVDLGVSLHSVDKKFLHGYWRECFANRQQLFLIFVRAEPMMMGGGGMGQTPPQLGARAVALVWRDPTPTAEDNNGQPRPHRTRLLFYRQFD